MYTLVWWNGTEYISAEYSTFDEALAQGNADASKPGGPEIRHVLNGDKIVIAGWAPADHGIQYQMSQEELATYATNLRLEEIAKQNEGS